MPYVNSVLLEPDQAVAQGACPECGRDLAQSSFEVERALHWPSFMDSTKTPPEAYQRIQLLKDYFDTLAKPATSSRRSN
jgi:hypothetical protein